LNRNDEYQDVGNTCQDVSEQTANKRNKVLKAAQKNTSNIKGANLATVNFKETGADHQI
jgi:hypothetical protein